jgi:hypothetical protein
MDFKTLQQLSAERIEELVKDVQAIDAQILTFVEEFEHGHGFRRVSK